MIADQPPIAIVRPAAPRHGIGTAVLSQTGAYSPPVRVTVTGGADNLVTPRAPRGCRVTTGHVTPAARRQGIHMTTWICTESARLGMYEAGE